MELITDIFISLQGMLEQSIIFAVSASFLWGILSVVLSPCHISSIPIMVGYINGDGKKDTKKVVFMTALFSLGIFLAIILIGIITSLSGRMLGDVGNIGIYVFGAVFILTGIWMLDFINIQIPMVNFSVMKNTGGIVMGMLFGAVLGPCTFGFMFPVLAVAFKYAGTNIVYAILITVFYALGHSLVIILAGTFINALQIFLNWDSKSKGTMIIKKLSGVAVIITGVVLITDKIIK